MQIKIMTIPPQGGEAVMEELNTFLRSNRVVEIKKEFDPTIGWSFCISYVENTSTPASELRDRGKKQENERFASLTDEQRIVYAKLKDARKEIYQKEGISAFLVFTNIELMEMAQLPVLSIETISALDSVKKEHIKKYGSQLMDKYQQLNQTANEDMGSPF